MLLRIPTSIGEKKKFKLVPVQLLRISPMKTVWMNFGTELKLLNREGNHLCDFMSKETQSFCTVSGNGHLIMRGKFNEQMIQTLLIKYCKEYVLCHSCSSANTGLLSESRLHFIQCYTCMSRLIVL
jgi:translation initiation factor 2 subunit 2